MYGNNILIAAIKTTYFRFRKGKKAWIEPRMLITAVRKTHSGVVVECEAERKIEEPISPGALYNSPSSAAEVFEIHKTLEKHGNNIKFESFHTDKVPPKVGRTYFFRSWMTAEAIEIIKDTSAEWTKKICSEDITHIHCPITYEAIGIREQENNKAFFNEKHGWITSKAYEKYISSDFLRLRRKKSS